MIYQKKVKLLLIKGYNFLLGRSHFKGDDGYQNFVKMLNSLTLNNNKKLTKQI